MADFEFPEYKYGANFPTVACEGDRCSYSTKATVTPGSTWEDATNSIKILKDLPIDLVPLRVTVQNADFDDATDLDITLRAVDESDTPKVFNISAVGATTFQDAANTTYALQGGTAAGDAAMDTGDSVEDWKDTFDGGTPYDLEIDITTAAGSAAGNAGEISINIDFMLAPRNVGTVKNPEIADGQA